ncbi:MAG: hypothetical protein NVS9B14_04070 [Candidatus Acidiferrum sp.]
MKRCPYCAEAIQDDAQVCPHCQMSLVGNVYAAPAAAQPPPGFTQPQSPPPAMGGDGYPAPAAETSGKAVASLVSAIAAYVILPFVGAIVAIVLGHLGLSEIKKSAGRLKGDGMAIAGLVLGYIQFALIPFILIVAAIAIPNLLRARMAANEASAVGSLRTLTTAEISYSAACPKIGFAYALTELGPDGSACPDGKNLIDYSLASGLKSGYRFTPHVSSFTGQTPETGFGWNADPVKVGSGATGMRHFFVDQTGVIRVSTTGQADEHSEPVR